MAETEQQHRINLNTSVVDSEILLAKRGQIFGLVTSILCISGAVILGFMGMQWLGGVLVGMSAIGLVRAFIKRRDHSEPAAKH